MELLQFLTLNLCGFDPGLEAGSRLAIKSNLVIYLVPYLFFTGVTLQIAMNPYSHHVLADEISESDSDYSESNKYRNFWGYEIDMMNNMAKILNFTYAIENSPDGLWGGIEPDGNWNGLVYHVSQDSADIIISEIFLSYGRQSVRIRKQNVICKFA